MLSLSRAEKVRRMRGIILPMLVILWILGSIYDGIANPTEAAGVGVFGAIAAAWWRERLPWAMLQEALRKTTFTVATIAW